MKSVVDEDLSDDVVSVCGILLPKLSVDDDTSMPLVFPDIVPVPSTQRNLRSLALAVSSGSPVLLQGPVGSGKTALVEYLAKLTGRTRPQQIMKVQLGDQTDSKTLLGTYKCTDVPGEFVWQPGTLTRAITDGQWLLLEDIDYAPMDVVSILLPILESRTLSLPGHGDTIQAAPGFHLFVTQRLMGSSSGWYKQHGSNAGLLEKLWSTVMVEPLSRQELEKVIVSKFPKFSTVVDRLLDVYFMVSSGRHELSGDTMETDVGDTIGQFLSHDGRLISTSFKPMDLKHVISPVREDFEILFCQCFSRKQNMTFLGHLQECFAKRRWSDLVKLLEHPTQLAVKKYENDPGLSKLWVKIQKRLQQLKLQAKYADSALAFSFIEGTLVKAMKSGDWVLLDEINLSAAETLECLGGLLESSSGSLLLMERGDTEPVVRHKDFRLFACMNPATDVGKKDLPAGIRNRFTELYVDEVEDDSDLRILVAEYLKGLSLTAKQIDGIIKFYQIIRNEAVKKLVDGTGHKPHYSLRTLCRALRQAASNTYGNVLRSLYEGFCFSFLTQLDRSSHPIVEQLVCQHVVGRQNVKSILKHPLPEPSIGTYLKFEGYWIHQGTVEPHVNESYVLTPSVRANLRDLARVVTAGKHPVLIQGETSVGKTSLIKWLADASGNHCVRVNNHEHTDLQEYIGCYAADEHGKLVFKEGVLVDAMRKGQWIILDELNLAPTDVLEALNRLLDDNRELFIPETQQTVKAHHHFMLFATQNPPGLYGGRKVLSRAFRNRFVELHYDELPSSELELILHQRCKMPMSYCKKLVAVMLELQTIRRTSSVFAGKQGYITLRDLFRWAERYTKASIASTASFYDWDQYLADSGYMLLAGRVRKPEEAKVIVTVLQKHLKRKVNPADLFSTGQKSRDYVRDMMQGIMGVAEDDFRHIVWTSNMKRLAVLVGQAVKYGEPVLLIGETGCGKTTMCQLLATRAGLTLYSINCHLHTESADFLGGLRPVRNRESKDDELRLFEWCDGPLVTAMKEGAMILMDEISLADDSVLERLNSVLEPERRLLLAEKGGGDGKQNNVEEITAAETFQILATMNPGGDYGKKELSPALRNRFTEIWCPQSTDYADLVEIIEHNLKSGIHLVNQEDGSSGIGRAIMDFVQWFSNNDIGKRCTVSIRDLLSWVNFINVCSKTIKDDSEMDTNTSCPKLEPAVAYIHGACLVFIDSLGSGVTSASNSHLTEETRKACMQFLINQLQQMTHTTFDVATLYVDSTYREIVDSSTHFGILPFYVQKGQNRTTLPSDYAANAPTTSKNLQRLLRGLQLHRPLLLEGSPGVGKTSLVSALAKAAGHELVRINLSDQTDVSDLFGADLPVEGGEGGQFAWRDGPLLKALKAGHWIVLDELNLASQSVLEGLNACLDHRGEVYVPELGRTFNVDHEKTRLFACQNPLNQGGGRKGLPRSFLNRFTQVYVEPLSLEDLLFITTSIYSLIPTSILSNMVDFNTKMYEETMVTCQWGQRGSPWEFNLRDIFRWCDLLVQNQTSDSFSPGEYVGLIYTDRMRTAADKEKVSKLYQEVFGPSHPLNKPTSYTEITSTFIQVGHSILERDESGFSTVDHQSSLQLLHHDLEPLEAIMKCIQMNWMAILVGSSASGKSSLVQVLSQLTNHKLHTIAMNSSMDTTELLGGFEQADIGRHISDVSSKVEAVAMSCCRQLLQHQKPSSSASIMKAWSEMKEGSQTVKSSSSVEELEGMRERLFRCERLLHHVEEACQKFSLLVSDEASTLKKELLALKKKVDGKGYRSGGGGQFEWVDSVLVEALKNGDWLLIDNVNFCSPSVLDRLNALLEPNGILTINERGVIDGEIPSVKPHPDFRLFLAMDPKHGEISRAMRNRGIEICILGESEGCAYDTHDVQRMLHSLGFVGKHPCDILLQIQAELQTYCYMTEHYTIVDLLHAARLAVQQLERGDNLQAAMLNACNDVYIKRQKEFSRRQEVREIIESHILKLEALMSDSETEKSALMVPGVWPDVMPSVSSSAVDPALATIHQQSVPLLHQINQYLLMNQAKTQFPLKYSAMSGSKSVTSTLDMESVKGIQKSIKFAAEIFTELATFSDWKLRSDWLLSTLKRRVSPESMGLVKQITDVVESGLQVVFAGPLIEKLHVDVASAESPLDVRWNPLMREKLVKSHPQIYEDLESYLNQSHLLKKIQQACVQSVSVKKHQSMSFIELSAAVQQGVLSASSLPSPVLVHLYPFLQAFEEELVKLVSNKNVTITNDALQKLLVSLSWKQQFIDVCSIQVKGRGAAQPLLAELALHWNWLQNKTFASFFQHVSPSPGLQSIITRLQEVLGTDDRASKLHLKLWSSFGHPSGFTTQEMAELVLQGEELSDALSVEMARDVFALVEYLRGEGRQIRKDMLNIIIGVMEKADQEFVQENFQGMSSQLTAAGFYKPTPGGDTVKAVPRCVLSMVPLVTYLSLLQEKCVMVKMLEGESEAYIQKFLMYSLVHDVTPVRRLVPYQALLNAEDGQHWEHFSGLLLYHIQHMFHSTYTSQLLDWVTWKDPGGEMQGEERPIVQGPGSLQTCQLSYAIMSLHASTDTKLTGKDDGSTICQMSVPLGLAAEKVKQFGNMAKMLWTHVEMLSSEDRSPRSMDIKLIQEVFSHLLQALRSLLPVENIPATEILVELSKSNILPEVVMQILTSCSEMVTTLKAGDENVLVKLGEVWAKIGLVQTHLLSPTGPVDPVHKVAVRYRYIKEEIGDIEKELEVRRWAWMLWTGKEFTDEALSAQHPRLANLIARRDLLKNKAEVLADRLALRPEPSQFGGILQYAHQFLTTVCSMETVIATLDKLSSAMTDLKDPSTDASWVQNLLIQESSWQASIEQYIKKMEIDYPLYRDLLVPYIAGIAQVSYGVRLVRHAVEVQWRQCQLYADLPQIVDVPLEDMISNLTKFPTLSSNTATFLVATEQLTSQPVSALVKRFSKVPGQDIAKVWKSALLHAKNHAVISNDLDPSISSTLNLIFDFFFTSWQEEEVARQQMEEEKASLYKYKATTHGDERNEEERELEDIHDNFPSFDKEFADIVNEDNLENQAQAAADDTQEDATLSAEAHMTPQDMATVANVHNLIYTHLVKGSWLTVQQIDQKGLNVVEPVTLGHQVAQTLVQSMVRYLDVTLDKELLGSHLLVNKLMQDAVQAGTKLGFSAKTSQKPYDIYHDANTSEVMPCLMVLDRMLAKLNELLESWPDHPTLKQLILIIQRIKSFSVTQPLMKFVTGLEVLLQKAQDWESIAARHVSLMSNLEEVTQLVINWRKLELKCWNRCLDMVEWRMKEAASKWWFHLYQLLSGYVAEKDEWSENGEKKLIEALKKFIEMAPLGEFKTRLDLLFAFHCQLLHEPSTPVQDKAIRILWNIFKFYSQFTANLDANAARQRTPIEKDLKGFVKIARWNDVNYWAVKQATEKTHRTLHKNIKKYQAILMQPANRFFIDKEEKHDESSQSQQTGVKVMLYLTPKDAMGVNEVSVPEGSSATPSFYQKMCRLSKKIIKKVPYTNLVESVDFFVGDVIESVHELQALDVTQISDKDKQKSEAKLIHQRKRKGLADLFKALSDLGLSYRKGLMAVKDADEVQEMTVPPVDLQATLNNMESQGCDEDLVQLWPGCDHYLYKSVARKALMKTAMESPSKELGLPTIERCRGFTEHLMLLIRNQRKHIADAVEPFMQLRQCASEFQSLKTSKPGLPPQTQTLEIRSELHGLLVQCIECFQQYHVLLRCSPDASFPTETPLVKLSPMALVTLGDETWTELEQTMSGLLNEVYATKATLDSLPSSGLVSWSVVESIEKAYQTISNWTAKISSIVNVCGEESSVFTESLMFVGEQISQACQSFTSWLESINTASQSPEPTEEPLTRFEAKVEKLVTAILLVIQNLFKAQVLEKEDEEKDKEEDAEFDLGGGKFVEVTQTVLASDMKVLNMKKITRSITKLKKHVMAVSDTDSFQASAYSSKLMTIVPFLSQYTKLVQFYLTQQVATHRATCKMLSVLLGIFSELAQKGFCLPAEFSDEIGGEGSTKFEDIEGGGLGEGEGQKDVSDQIENEDQLEDTYKEGEERKEEDTSQQPDVESEENAIEMSEEFGGKLQDVDQQEGSGESGSEDEEDDIDKQMGDVDQKEAEKLDERIWGSDDEDDQTEQKEEKEEEYGPGAGERSESELVAAEDNKDKTKGDEEQKEGQKDEQKHEEKINNKDEIDETEYDENEADPYYGKEEEKPPEGPDMELPDNMELDDEEGQEGQEEGEKENPHDIDKMDIGDDGETEDKEPGEQDMETDGKEEEGQGEDDDDKGQEVQGQEEEGQDDEAEGREEPGTQDDEDNAQEIPEREKEEGGEQRGDPALEPQPTEEATTPEGEEKADDVPMAAENYGKKEHDTQNAQQSEAAQDQAGKSDSTEDQEGVGTAETEDQSGHEGQTTTHMAVNAPAQGQNKPIRRQPGKTEADRSLGSAEEKIKQRLQTVDTQDSQDTKKESADDTSDLYEHIKQTDQHHDAQTLDAATAEQMEEQPRADLEGDKMKDDEEDVHMHEDEDKETQKNDQELKPVSTMKPSKSSLMQGEEAEADEEKDMECVVEGEKVPTMAVQRGYESSMHTAMDVFNEQVDDVDKLREELEQQLVVWSHPASESLEQQKLAEEAWHRYESLTGSLAQELCEQLRLVLEPTQATKLRGDYRTGKRLNMRKVIPYIASQFRKDKIWLRRTKPSKRQYQIMLAVDDSSSMLDNHSKQLAFESLSVVANALTLLEAGELSVCSFGETMELLHPFHEPFTSQSGARLLTKFTFEQKKTRIAQLLKDVTKVMLNAQSSQSGGRSGDVSQLLMIVSDGRGLFLEGMDVVKNAVRQARHTNIFTVFIIIDNPENKDSILDIRVPVFKGAGQLPEIKSYMDHFPFPFYIVLRDINALPHILSDALRQWFELITAVDT
ncbi:midasin-like [Lineus longissimus]|uniref:midasin-like n=1 Tax=Lineus longissimus TaxID=88925 RepID=UPI00315D2C1E